jgi:hypothetical protein
MQASVKRDKTATDALAMNHLSIPTSSTMYDPFVCVTYSLLFFRALLLPMRWENWRSPMPLFWNKLTADGKLFFVSGQDRGSGLCAVTCGGNSIASSDPEFQFALLPLVRTGSTRERKEILGQKSALAI